MFAAFLLFSKQCISFRLHPTRDTLGPGDLEWLVDKIIRGKRSEVTVTAFRSELGENHE